MDDVDYWTRRFEHYDDAARALFDKTIQLVGIGLTLLISATAALVAFGKFEVVLVVPVVVILLWAVAARMLHEQLLLGVYRDYAEERAVGYRVAVHADPRADPRTIFDSWQSNGGDKISKGWPNTYVYSVLALVSIGLIAGGLFASRAYSPTLDPGFWVAVLVFVVLAFVGGVIAFWISQAQVTTMYAAVRELVRQRESEAAAGAAAAAAAGSGSEEPS